MVRDVGAGSTLPARFDVRTAYDFAISLTSDVGEHDELPAEDRRWLERARAALPDSVRPAVDSELAIFGSGLIVDRPEISDAASFVGLLQDTTGREFVGAVLADQMRDSGHEAEIAAALDGDRAAIDAVLGSWPEHKHGWLSRILSDSDELVGEVAELMAAWLPLYLEIEPKVRTIIERDMALAPATAHVRIAWFAAAIFAVHPMQSEAVNYIFARSTLLMSLFCLLSLNDWLRGRHWRAVLWFTLGLLSKEEAVGLRSSSRCFTCRSPAIERNGGRLRRCSACRSCSDCGCCL